MNCPNCGMPQHQPKDKIEPIEVRHTVNGVVISSKVIPYDDAFYEIVVGKYRGNLVHRWNIVK